MTGTAPEAGFSLAYELKPDDFEEIYRAEPTRKRLRTGWAFAAVPFVLVSAILTIFTVTVDLKAGANNSSGAPGWIYVVDATMWGLAAFPSLLVWRLSPRRLARRYWDDNVGRHGRYHDEVGPGGLVARAPDGSQVSVPWAAIVRVDETDRAFSAVDYDDQVRIVLPKRGLASPDLVPALREFLNNSAGGQPPAAASAAAHDAPSA
jgi:hypothetical protein